MPGRPKKKRFRAAHEPKAGSDRISRAGAVMTCKNCGEAGHNKKGCKKSSIPSVTKEKGKPGRPKKKQNAQDELVDDHDIPRFVNNEIN